MRLTTNKASSILMLIATIISGCDQFAPQNLGGPRSVGTKLGGPATISPEMQDRGFLGVRLVSDPGTDVDAVVARVIPGTAAALAGMQDGDTIQKVDGAAISGREEFQTLAKTWKPNQTITLELVHSGSTRQLQVRLMTFDEYMPLLQAAGE